MKYPCEMVQDMLPLYHDRACSEETRKAVEEHLEECASCKEQLQRLQGRDYESDLIIEREEVLWHHTRKIRGRLSELVACVLLVPLVICLTVNLATAHTLNWFFIVLTGMAVFASLVLVPLLTAEKKLLWTSVSFTGSLLLLLFTCCQFSGGHWFTLAAVAVLLGLSVAGLPLIVQEIPFQGFAARNKGFLVLLTDTVLLYLLIVVCGIYIGSASYWSPALWITTACMIFVWVIFWILRYARLDVLIRAGVCFLIGGIFLSHINALVDLILNGVWRIRIKDLNLLAWNSDVAVNANIDFLVLVFCFLTGGILLGMGLCRKRK